MAADKTSIEALRAFTDAELDVLRELGRQGCRQLTALQRGARQPA